MKTRALLLACVLAATVATTVQAQSSSSQSKGREVWEWKDPNGVTHYSDQPTPGARRIVISAQSTSVSPQATVTPVRPPAPRPGAQPTAATVQYARLEIWQPANETSFFGADATVNVRLRSEPDLQPGDQLLTYLDGKLVGGQNSTELTLTGLDRGVHSLTSVILDAKGNEKIRSNDVVFYVKQPSVLSPQSPVRPRPGG
jgi:hypothetical protein